MNDPLVHGSPELRRDIPLFTGHVIRTPNYSKAHNAGDQTPILTAVLAQNGQAPTKPLDTLEGEQRERVPEPELSVQDLKDHAEHVNCLKTAENERLKHRRQRRRARKEEKRNIHEYRKAAMERLSALSERVYASAQEISKTARHKKMPHICLVGPSQMDTNMLIEWYRFCRKAAHTRMLHKEEETAQKDYKVLVFNRNGDVVVFERPWVERIVQEKRLHALYALAVFDASHTLTDLSKLPDKHAVFVYDPQDDASCDLMLKWKCDGHHHVCPIIQSGEQKTCVIKRDNQIFRRYNLA